jgi:hypothetical protein
MAGPSTKPRGSEREPVMVPHPDDVEAVREDLLPGTGDVRALLPPTR